MISELSQSSLKETISCNFHQCRAKTLALFVGIDEVTFCAQAHPDFSPIGWHLGHIAYTESLWLLEHSADLPCLFPQYRKLFAANGLPKCDRVKLPTLEKTLHYLDTVRAKVLDYLELADLKQQERLWQFILQHESQHSEIITFLLELGKQERRQLSLSPRRQEYQITSPPRERHRLTNPGEVVLQASTTELPAARKRPPLTSTPPFTEMIEIPGGEFEMGDSSVDALDNERSAHIVYLDTYCIDRYPVTCGQYLAFMEAGGYQNPRWWSKAGWEWLQTEQVTQPLYWCNNPAWDNHPVYGVSWYEAQAYSQFVGKRLPTEAEWEKAVSWDAKANRRRIYPWGNEQPTLELCNHDNFMERTTPVDTFPTGQSAYGLYDALGNVWEWTASWFDGYKGFQYYPYIGYSQVYFDQQHRVLKGGSWATRPWVLRSSFRNWYQPGVRQILAGFRCATSTNFLS
ncbi:ergothioneine biosynthesis protein EgtB [Mastigocladopsis repens]|uniref:ergothioneine biosynthesis protein EgtB n=1 Tax=Mastigocladopsis repens TaxID=221287 RepID=UPI0003061745|nr:ergothioneine biosynthesis protein EgtB [Mastigocladopsis repens]